MWKVRHLSAQLGALIALIAGPSYLLQALLIVRTDDDDKLLWIRMFILQ